MLEKPELYPELQSLQRIWVPLRDEVATISYAAREVADERAATGAWRVLPFRPRPEERGLFPNETVALVRKKAPQLCAVLDELPRVHAYYVSVVAPGCAIRVHSHRTALAGASLCLSGGMGAYLEIDGERHSQHDGSIHIYDQRRRHGVMNDGNNPRVALIVAMELRK
jgi:quercetin dioxygenase-like cupin family protein